VIWRLVASSCTNGARSWSLKRPAPSTAWARRASSFPIRRKRITKIDEAFGRIDDGSYGRCEECDREIGIARLRARPVTTLCIDCKSLQEAQERKLRTL